MFPTGSVRRAPAGRCPGEWIAVELMKRATRRLAGGMQYEVPPQDLDLDMRRLPAIPKSGFLVAVR